MRVFSGFSIPYLLPKTNNKSDTVSFKAGLSEKTLLIQNIDSQIQYLKRQNKNLEALIKKNQAILDAPFKDINQEKIKLQSEYEKKASEFVKEIKLKKEELLALEKKKNDLNKENAQLKKLLNNEDNIKLSKKLDEKVSKLTQKIRKKKEEIRNTQNEKNAAERDYSVNSSKLDEIKNKIRSDKKAEREPLLREISDAEIQINKNKSAIKTLENERNILTRKSKAERLKDKKRRSEKRLNETKERKRVKEQQLAELYKLTLEKKKNKPNAQVSTSAVNNPVNHTTKREKPYTHNPKKELKPKTINQIRFNQLESSLHTSPVTSHFNDIEIPANNLTIDPVTAELINKFHKQTFFLNQVQNIMNPHRSSAPKRPVKLDDEDIDYAEIIRLKHIPKSFEAGDKKLPLDKYQKEAIKAFKEGKTVIVTAPTGTGKTLIAEYAIDEAIRSGKKIYYLAPLKALSNEKYTKFSELFGNYDKLGKLIGKENVGLITGDVKVNEDAPVIVMTTEVYRNMVTSGTKEEISSRLSDVAAVIFDEFHYLGDADRGTVWEESIMFSPPDTQFLMLSATASNADQIRNWLGAINSKRAVELVNVPEEERHVPLKFLTYMHTSKSSKKESKPELVNLMSSFINLDKLDKNNLSSKVKETLAVITKRYSHNPDNNELSIKDTIDLIKNEFSEIIKNDLASKKINVNDFVKKLTNDGFLPTQAEQIALTLADSKSRVLNPEMGKFHPPSKLRILSLIRDLNDQNKLPAIFFIFSKKNCKKALINSSGTIGTLLNEKQRQLVEERINECKQQGIFLGNDFDTIYKPALIKGYAVHHAGMLPAYKSLVEELLRDGLVKVVFATETLVAGINMPVKTVVWTSAEKMTSSGIQPVTSSLLKQGSGRAGRRGIDDIGYAVLAFNKENSISNAFELLTTKSNEIDSNLTPSYNFILSPQVFEDPESALNRSFRYFQTGDYVGLQQQAEQMKKMLFKWEMIEPVDKDKTEQLKNQIQDKNQNLSDIKFKITPKGEIASKIRGINEILLTELISNQEITNNITPSELAGLISIFAETRPRSFTALNYQESLKSLQQKVENAIKLAEIIKEDQRKLIIDQPIYINTKFAPFIKEWADCPNTANFDNIVWKEIMNKLCSNEILTQEGDFLKVVNGTIDILKQITEISPDSELAEKAKEAVNMLNKPPVNDILRYELDLDVSKTDNLSDKTSSELQKAI